MLKALGVPSDAVDSDSSTDNRLIMSKVGTTSLNLIEHAQYDSPHL